MKRGTVVEIQMQKFHTTVKQFKTEIMLCLCHTATGSFVIHISEFQMYTSTFFQLLNVIKYIIHGICADYEVATFSMRNMLILYAVAVLHGL